MIGEHTDYNEGFVLPCAIASDTRVLASVRNDDMLSARSYDTQQAVFDLKSLPEKRQGSWSDYLCGVLVELRNAGIALSPADLTISGSVPIGAGLSSSASFEIAVALAMLSLARASMPKTELAKLAQRAETNFVGIRCGIMDQFTVLYAQAGSALFLDTRSLEFEQIEVPPSAAIVVSNTMVKHSLASSAYNQRRAQCEEGVHLLQQIDPDIRALRDVSLDALESAKGMLPAVLYRRCRHVVSENARVQAAAQTLREGSLDRFGTLMYASHESLRSDYEVSCEELDIMVDLAKRFAGTIGARMTGGGFGGCTVNVVQAPKARAFAEYIREAYHRATGITPEVYDGTPSDGASVVDR